MVKSRALDDLGNNSNNRVFVTQDMSTGGAERKDIRISRNIIKMMDGTSFRAIRLGNGQTRYSAVGPIGEDVGSITIDVPPELEDTLDEIELFGKIQELAKQVVKLVGSALSAMGDGKTGTGGSGSGGSGGNGTGCDIEINNNKGTVIVNGCGGSGGTGGSGQGGTGSG